MPSYLFEDEDPLILAAALLVGIAAGLSWGFGAGLICGGLAGLAIAWLVLRIG